MGGEGPATESLPQDDLSSSPASEQPRTNNQTCDDDLLSGQLIGLGDVSGFLMAPTTVRPHQLYRRLLALIAPPAITASQLPTYFRRRHPHAEIITQTGIAITRSRIVSERELFCSDSQRTKA